MFGVLLDVSGSMENTFSVHYDDCSGLRTGRYDVKRSHGIITTLNNIINQEITSYGRKDLAFACAFGLNITKCKGSDTCDFISLLENREVLKELERREERWEKEYTQTGHQRLINLARKHRNASHVEPWITERLSQKQAGILWEILKDDHQSTSKLIKMVPTPGVITSGVHTAKSFTRECSNIASYVPSLIGGGKLRGVTSSMEHSIDQKIDNHEALKLARRLIEKESSKYEYVLKKIQTLKSHFANDASKLLNTILQENKEASSHRVHEIIDSIKPYIYGKTPMVKALTKAKEIFDTKPEINPKVLFILSDGLSTDGDPNYIAQMLRDSKVAVVTCYLTLEKISNAKCLVDKEDPLWTEGARVMYRMSSTMPNTNAPIVHLIDYRWELPLSGESHLFVRANSLDVVEEFCKVAVSQFTHGTDALIHMLGRLSLTTYINQSIDDFKAQQQRGGTCYANAIATVFHLAMNQIVGREGGVPMFSQILERIVSEYGECGANTEEVLDKVSREYRLYYQRVSEIGARKAINER